VAVFCEHGNELSDSMGGGVICRVAEWVLLASQEGHCSMELYERFI
jgi:hypothetical protein